METIGQKLNPLLVEIEDTLLEFAFNNGSKPNFPAESLRASAKIFMSVFMDKIFELQNNENIAMEDRMIMVQRAGEDFRKLIKTYTDIDSHDFYK